MFRSIKLHENSQKKLVHGKTNDIITDQENKTKKHGIRKEKCINKCISLLL